MGALEPKRKIMHPFFFVMKYMDGSQQLELELREEMFMRVGSQVDFLKFKI
jgi:hypothetical protein